MKKKDCVCVCVRDYNHKTQKMESQENCVGFQLSKRLKIDLLPQHHYQFTYIPEFPYSDLRKKYLEVKKKELEKKRMEILQKNTLILWSDND